MPNIYYIDLFSGAGGTTTGIHMVDSGVKVIACVNHDLNAIESHRANHPDCLHFVEDVRDFRVVVALRNLVAKTRQEDPDAIIAIWASLECTNYSKAKGGLPRDADSRTLAHALYMYVEELDPDYIDIENVREFMAWGPLDGKGRPISKLNGRDYKAWVERMQSYGFDYEWSLLNAADFGAYTSRERYFGQFAKYDLPIVWPKPTHSKSPDKNRLLQALKKWKPVREVLDLNDEGQSIFTRKKPLSENTLKRIYAGLIKFVAGGESKFLQHYYGNGFCSSVENPCPTLRTKDSAYLVDYQYKSNSHSLDKPAPTLVTKDKFATVQPQFITNYYNGGGQLSSIDKPNPTVTSIPKQRLTSVLFMDQQFGNSKPHGLDRPAGTVTANPKQNVVSVDPWLMDTNFGNVGRSMDQPSRVITANRKHQYLLNPGWGGNCHSIEKPSPVIVARQDKAPVSVIQTSPSKFFAIPFFDVENTTMQKIRLFMAVYGIIDIKMRMLRIDELLRIQGFPEDYILKGTKTEQKKYIGNAVVPVVAKALIQNRVEIIKKENKVAV